VQCSYDAGTGDTDPHSGKEEAEKNIAHKKPPGKVPFEVQISESRNMLDTTVHCCVLALKKAEDLNSLHFEPHGSLSYLPLHL
jgi:hypothetical protein